ncbi:MAG: hypothetical protein QNJ36_01560 [Calothrix sp. MO_167.B42]|nr:hypothetical protein [Calothrix sp. MO_167.B42]
MSQEPPNSPQPKNKRKSRSRRGSDGTSPTKSSQPPSRQNIVSNLLRGISGLFETGAVKLPTPARIGIIAVIVAMAIWAISNLFSTKPNQVANVTPTLETPVSNIEKELEVKPTPLPEVTPTPSIEETPLPQPETEPTPALQIIPTPSIGETPLPQPETEPTPAPEITPSPSIEDTPLPEPETQVTPTQSTEEIPPSEPETKATAVPEETPLSEPEVTPTPIPPKKIVLTPEQALIAAIENKVAEISDRIAPGLIQSIQANFRTSSLTVIIGDQWYNLPTSEQRKLATDMLQRSQELDFSHLEIMDAQKKLVARNPVVGTEIILFTPVSKS